MGEVKKDHIILTIQALLFLNLPHRKNCICEAKFDFGAIRAITDFKFDLRCKQCRKAMKILDSGLSQDKGAPK